MFQAIPEQSQAYFNTRFVTNKNNPVINTK